ncbi:anhydro-N-acetylmuramic acid kinase [Lacinutrix neustonica]|uniref:Anhydro-N-acetylmuramic acid kinase n=1 Tax=Lacinutrix neustonica TaxID=2980107 RepID=A0A9E8MXM5_9FLAO|nr:anhydro-N-acetylmuramic acid kinase [Lacinutrix neustonica]WAC03443.1 anhydro-N-acetylmuramic acid kinase [Lacinutrix neustonica]
MIKNEYHIIGVMSGTSLDGIDLALVTFTFNNKWTFKINVAETIPYSEKWQLELKTLINHTKEELYLIDQYYTEYLADVINQFILKHNIDTIDAVCSHGHTALHQPDRQLTYQIGNLPLLVKKLKQRVICDFRVQDVALGGQGAPLVPIGDELLFSKYDYCVNLGGFANVSTKTQSKRIAFDICPVNIVLNKYISTLGFSYDAEGRVASEGEINTALLSKLNDLTFYKESHPKSPGLEWVNEVIFPLMERYALTVKDVLRTYVEHIAIQIAEVINQKPNAKVLITGGGVFNLFLMDRIKRLSKNQIIIPSQEIIEFKEALIFGFLGVLKWRGENNCLSSVTGAVKDHASGMIYEP